MDQCGSSDRKVLPLTTPSNNKVKCQRWGFFLLNRILFLLPIFYSWSLVGGTCPSSFASPHQPFHRHTGRNFLDNLILPGCYLAKPSFTLTIFSPPLLGFLSLIPAPIIFSPASIQFCWPLISFFLCPLQPSSSSSSLLMWRHKLFMQIRAFHALFCCSRLPTLMCAKAAFSLL